MAGCAWSRAEVAVLKASFGSVSNWMIAEVMRREVGDIEIKGDQLSLRKSKVNFSGTVMPRWTSRQLDRLVELHPKHSNLYIAQRIGRSEKSVASKACDLRLRKSKGHIRETSRQNIAVRYEDRST